MQLIVEAGWCLSSLPPLMLQAELVTCWDAKRSGEMTSGRETHEAACYDDQLSLMTCSCRQPTTPGRRAFQAGAGHFWEALCKSTGAWPPILF